MPAAETISPPATIDQFVRRAGALYSLPAVAVEVLRLTDHPKVDVPALKACIERDPALTAKLLRVVNSSLFGLPREVGDLNQALGLLGTKPLKLLVLGFSLPENLFLEVAGPQLDWYWNSTLARAVAAREISEQLFARPGDDAFLAGLLQDLGVLVLLGQLRGPYAALIAESIETGADLRQLEQRDLGFDHAQLTSGLLDAWNMPPALVRAIGQPLDHRRWARSRADHAPLIRILHLAELVAQLVGQRRLSVLPDLLEAGGAYCGLDKPKLYDLVGALEPKVRQLAGVLSIDAKSTGDYSAVIVEAHARMSHLAEMAASQLCGLEGRAAGGELCGGAEEGVVLAVSELRLAVDQFLNRRELMQAATSPIATPEGAPTAAAAVIKPTASSIKFLGPPRDDFMVRLLLAVGQCRSAREPLSVVLMGVAELTPLDVGQRQLLEHLLDDACREFGVSTGSVERLAPGRRAVTLARRDRREAVATARRAVEEIGKHLESRRLIGRFPSCIVAAGVASVLIPAKNFQAARLLETAQRCLAAAISSGGVKSLEVS